MFNNQKKYKISIIIPTHNDFEHFEKLIISIINQTLLPDEVIIIDSSHNDKIDFFLEITKMPFRLIYKRLYHKNRFSKLTPGKARNIGFENSSSDYIIFLDTKTIPDNFWIEKNFNIINSTNSDLIIGQTIYKSNNYFTTVTLFATHGNQVTQTLPGTIIKNNILHNFKFIENVRSGEDLEWKERILKDKKNLFSATPLEYSSLPHNIYLLLKKYFIYNINGAFIDVQNNQKDLYLSIILIISLFVLPRWNYYLTDWDNSYLFIPNIAKYYLISILFLLLNFIFLKKIFIDKLKLKFVSSTIKIISFIGIFYFVFRWNDIIANWAEDNILYVPHITKSFIILVFSSSLIFRGIIMPIKKKISAKDLFPFKWFFVGILGLLIDLIKAPGLILGSIISIMNLNSPKKIEK